jgi:hypothetical protein
MSNLDQVNRTMRQLGSQHQMQSDNEDSYSLNSVSPGVIKGEQVKPGLEDVRVVNARSIQFADDNPTTRLASHVTAPPEPNTDSNALEHSGLAPPVPKKEEKTAEELARMIHDDLSMVEGCPTRGVSVTVYGSNPWNSLLTFGAKAGPVRNKADLQVFCDVITERLKRLYSVKA